MMPSVQNSNISRGLGEMRSVVESVCVRVVDSMMMLLSRIQVQFALVSFRAPLAREWFGLEEPKRILLIQLYDTVGDVVFTSPLIRELAQSFPASSLTVAVSAHGVKGVLDVNPYISDTILVDVSCNKWLRPLLLPWRHWRFGRKVFKQRNFDLAIIPRSSVDSNYATFLAYFSGAPCRVGYTEKTSRRKSILNRSWDRLLTVTLPGSKESVNEVLLNLNVLAAFGKAAKSQRTEIWITNEDRQFASSALKALSGRRVCISPTSGHSWLKQWGVDRFAELVQKLVAHGCSIVLVGGPQDKALATSLEERAHHACMNLVGKTSIREMAAVASQCEMYVGNDAGPAHVASAMGIPTLTIFGSSCYHQFAPWGQRNRVLVVEMKCSPCGRGHGIDRCNRCIYEEPKCLREITVVEVLATTLSMLARRDVGEAQNEQLTLLSADDAREMPCQSSEPF